jgi:hypothetical protein
MITVKTEIQLHIIFVSSSNSTHAIILLHKDEICQFIFVYLQIYIAQEEY